MEFFYLDFDSDRNGSKGLGTGSGSTALLKRGLMKNYDSSYFWNYHNILADTVCVIIYR